MVFIRVLDKVAQYKALSIITWCLYYRLLASKNVQTRLELEMTHGLTVFTISSVGSQNWIHKLPRINTDYSNCALHNKKGSISNSEWDLCFIHVHCAFEYCILDYYQWL